MKSSAEHQAALPSGLTAAVVKAASLARIGIAVSFTEAGERRFVYVSDAAARLFGYEPHELLTRPTAATLGAEYVERVEVWREKHYSGAEVPSVIESEIPRKGGGTVAVRMTSSLARIDEREVSVDFLFDTGERRRAERLQAVKTRFRTLLDVAPEGVWIALVERIVYANPALMRMLGYAELDQFLGIPLRQHVHARDLPGLLGSFADLSRNDGSAGPLEIRLKHREGHYVSIEVVAMASDWEGQPAVLAIGRDLDQRRRLKSQSIQADRLTALGTLVAGVAHEINNPLAYVLLNLQYLLREVPKFDGDSARLKSFLDRLNEARHGTERVSTIVRDLRALARTEPDAKSPVDLQRVLASAIRVAAARTEGRARVIEDYRPVAEVDGNPARLEQVFLNLLINAAQAFPTLSPANEIRVSLRESNGQVIAEVTDNGSGIQSELLDRIFDPFFTTKPGIGTGLGLPISHRIVKSLGGKIEVSSEAGRGTTFSVSLPAMRRVQTKRSLTPEPGASQPRARVLVVDDELPLASMLRRVLSEQHEVVVATSAREALDELLGASEFDVVLCDLLMPGMSGMDLHRELARQKPGLERRLVFMTGGAFTLGATEFLASVPNERLEKPFDLNQVRRLVRKLSRLRARPASG